MITERGQKGEGGLLVFSTSTRYMYISIGGSIYTQSIS